MIILKALHLWAILQNFEKSLIDSNQQESTTSTSTPSLWGLWAWLFSSPFACPCPRGACSSKGKRPQLWAHGLRRRGHRDPRNRWCTRMKLAQGQRRWKTAARAGGAGRTWLLRAMYFGKASGSHILPGIYFSGFVLAIHITVWFKSTRVFAQFHFTSENEQIKWFCIISSELFSAVTALHTTITMICFNGDDLAGI